ncbi:aldehyde ferredoxin oxidoreductase family protein [Candidatus Eisenbacteria bacterium]|uniref:Aldehyde ferredoxin oxidoreductase family protein n=1 Tax=Eiseniibacteriota bacterium TaxID=2212470 RepID=A0ABV6YKE3_UNCEI
MFGYTGKTLEIDLSGGTIEVEELPKEVLLSSIGGRGLNSFRFYAHANSLAEPLTPEAPLLIGVGPLTGTGLPASARFTVTARSPLTGIFGHSNAGGHWASELKFAGFDQVLLTGKSDKPVVLLIDDGDVRFVDAADVWGKGIRETTRILKKKLNAYDGQVLAIGPAGENGVKYSCVAANLTRICGRTGMGAVMGSKNLKAVVVRGRGSIRVADQKKFDTLASDLREQIEDHSGFEKRRKLGTTALMTGLNELGILPTRHFQEGTAEYIDQISGEHLMANYNVKNKSCFNCNVHCSRYYIAEGAQGEGPEYETLCTFTSRLGCDDAVFALRMNDLVNDAGLDSISSGESIGWAIECAEHGLISKDEADGLDLSWGNKQVIETLLGKIIKREGFGKLLAEGVKIASEKIGRGSEEYAFHVKGLELICGDPRGLKAYGLTYAIASRGADHLHAEPFFEIEGDPKEAKERFGTEEAANRLAWRGKAKLVHWSERMALLTDCLTMCKNIGLCMDILTFELSAELLKVGTGLQWDEATLKKALDTVLATEKEYNKRAGMTEKDDTLPHRFLKEPLTEGPTAGSIVELDKMLDEYRELE